MLCPLSLFFSRLRSLFLFCDTASKAFQFLPHGSPALSFFITINKFLECLCYRIGIPALEKYHIFRRSVVLSFLTAKSTLYLRVTHSKDLILPSVTSIDETPTPSPTSFFTEVLPCVFCAFCLRWFKYMFLKNFLFRFRTSIFTMSIVLNRIYFKEKSEPPA